MESAGVQNTGGEGPSYIFCALPYKPDAEREGEWGLDTALAIVEEAVDAFDPAHTDCQPVTHTWPPDMEEIGQTIDTFEMMRTAYFNHGGNNLPDIGQMVPTLEANFYMWLSCRKQQWRQHRLDKKLRRQLTPEEDFPRHQRKWQWSSMKVTREAQKTPVLEENFDRWLAERKNVRRLQRMAKKH
ncbi:unnamed protein product, partial [Discosporangium mesarthrocarpum]